MIGRDAPIPYDYLGYYKQTLKEATRTDEKGESRAPKRSEEDEEEILFWKGVEVMWDSHRHSVEGKRREDGGNGGKMRRKEREKMKPRDRANVAVAWPAKRRARVHERLITMFIPLGCLSVVYRSLFWPGELHSTNVSNDTTTLLNQFDVWFNFILIIPFDVSISSSFHLRYSKNTRYM